MNHLETPSGWVRFVRNGAILTFVVAILLFWNSSHPADEISVTIGVPLIIFNCVPFVLAALLSRWLPETPQRPLPLPAEPVNIRALPLKQRLVGYASIGLVVGMILGFSAGVSIFLASFTYASLYVPWAVVPARHLSYLLLGVSSLPAVALSFFLLGLHYSGRFLNSAVLHWISTRARHPLTYWPTTA